MSNNIYDNIKILSCSEEDTIRFKCELPNRDIKTLTLSNIKENKKAISDYFIKSYNYKYVDKGTINIHNKVEKCLTDVDMSRKCSYLPVSIEFIRNNIVGYKTKGSDTVRTISANEFIKIDPSMFNEFVFNNILNLRSK